MIDYPQKQKYFPETTDVFESYLTVIDTLSKDPGSLYNLINEDPAETQFRKELNDVYLKEYNRLLKKGVYFYGCPINIYEQTYPLRLANFKQEVKGGEEYDFILLELREGIFKIPEGFSLLQDRYLIPLKAALRKRFQFLKIRLPDNVTIEVDDDDTFTPKYHTEDQEVVKRPHFFKTDKSFKAFLIYLNGCTRELQEVSFIKKQMQADGHIYDITDMDFTDWLRDNDYLRPNELEPLVAAGQLNSLNRSSTPSRITRYHSIFGSVTSD